MRDSENRTSLVDQESVQKLLNLVVFRMGRRVIVSIQDDSGRREKYCWDRPTIIFVFISLLRLNKYYTRSIMHNKTTEMPHSFLEHTGLVSFSLSWEMGSSALFKNL